MDQSFEAHLGFASRREAGALLGLRLQQYAGRDDVVVLGLPRGGVLVAYEVARALNAELDVFVVRTLGLPGNPELAIGAIAPGGARVLNPDIPAWARPSEAGIEAVAVAAQNELLRRERACRGDRPPVAIAGRIAILVDDGLSTGATMRAAVLAVRRLKPARVIVAVPVGAREACEAIRPIADQFICPYVPETFSGVGHWYLDFPQTTDEEVCRLLKAHRPVVPV
jgi:predicted phosphoribosyltransferase